MIRSLGLMIALVAVAVPLTAFSAEKPADPADQLLQETMPPPPPKPKPAAGKPQSAIVELSPAESARLRRELKVVTDRMLTDARDFYKQRDWDRCAAKCDEVIKRDPGNLDAQKLKYQAERNKIDHRLEMLDHEAKWKDKDAIADVDEGSNFPDKHGPLLRPVKSEKPAPLPLRTAAVAKTEKMLKMEQLLNQHVNFNMMDVDLEFLLTTLSRTTGVNIIADQAALTDKRLTLAVQDMPLKEVLRFIARTKDITYTLTEDAVWISAGNVNPALEPRIHALNVGLTIATPMQVQPGAGARPGGGAGLLMPAPVAAPGAPGGNQQQTETYLEQTLKWMKTWKEWPSGSQVELDKMNSSLLVYTTPEMHDKIDEMLEVMDRPPIQVLISTRFITVKVDDLRDIGLDFGMTSAPGQPVVATTGTGTSLGTTGITGGLSAIVQGAKTDPLFTATLKALETNGRGKLLSAPQIITLNNQKGHIDVTTAFNWVSSWTPVITTNTDSSSSTSVTSQNVTYMIPQITQTQVGFVLDVTPSVGRDLRHIVLELIPDITDVEGGTKDFGNIEILKADDPNQPPQPVPQPIINHKTLNTRMVVNDGDLVIIGGLMGQTTDKSVTKVPFLGDIPFLGALFRHTTDTISKTHLLIVVKAQIIDPTGRTYTDGNGPNGEAAAAGRGSPAGPWFTYPEPAPAAPAPAAAARRP